MTKKLFIALFVLVSGVACAQETPFEIGMGTNFYCVLSKKLWTEGRSQVKCWGSGAYHIDHKPLEVPVLKNVTAIAGARYTMCAVEDNRVKCWGYYEHKGENKMAAKTEAFFSKFNNVLHLSGGTDDICATDTLRGVNCYHFDRGDSVSTLSGVRKSSVGYAYACGMTPEGLVECWQTRERTCDKNSEKMPTDIRGPGEIAISAYGYSGGCSICAIAQNEVKCWGSAEKEKPAEASGLIAPRSLTMGDTSMREGKGVPCVVDEGTVKCRSKTGKFVPFEFFSDLKDVVTLQATAHLICAANHMALKCFFGDTFNQLPQRVPHGVWFAPFRLFELDEALSKLSMDTYKGKADVFRAGERSAKTLGLAMAAPDREVFRVFLLNALEPVVEFTETEFFTKLLRPNWQDLKKQFNPKYKITALNDFPKTDANKLASLELLRGAKGTLQRTLTTPEQVTRLDEFVAAVGKAIALKGNPSSLKDLEYTFAFLKPDITALSGGERERGVALMVLTLAEYLKP